MPQQGKVQGEYPTLDFQLPAHLSLEERNITPELSAIAEPWKIGDRDWMYAIYPGQSNELKLTCTTMLTHTCD